MSLPEPRDWLRDDPNHDQFGRAKPVRWKRARSKTDQALLTAAITQHEFAKAVKAHIRARQPRMTTTELARRTDLRIDQLRRVLRGETHLTLALMHLIATHAGLPLTSNNPDERP